MRNLALVLSMALAPAACLATTKPSVSGLALAEGAASRPLQRSDADHERWFMASFERHLRDGQRDLGCVNWYSVSPSARYVLYECSGFLSLYDALSHRLRVVDSHYISFPTTTTWP